MKTKKQIAAHEQYLVRISNPENVAMMKARKKEWVKNNPEKNKETQIRFKENNPNKELEYRDKYRGLYLKKARDNYKQNREKEIARSLKYNQEHVENTRRLRRESAQRARSTVKGKLLNSIRGGIQYSLHLKTVTKNGHWNEFVDFTIDQLKAHIEKLFTPEMNWDNYGTYWQIDHKIPIAVFNFEKPSDIDFKLCWSLKNLQPLERIANMKKQKSLIEPFQPSLAIGG